MSWTPVRLSDVIEKPLSGEWGDGEGTVKVLRTTNFTNDGTIDFSDVVERAISNKKIDQKKLIFGDTIIEKSGGSPSQPVGRVVFFDKTNDIFLCNNFTSVLRPKSAIDGKYLFWFLFNNHVTKNTLKYQNKTTGIINLQLERYISEIQIPLPPLSTQKRIAEILDTADDLRRKDQELLRKYDELAQAIFIDMFGDPVRNEKRWEEKILAEVVHPDKIITYGIVQAGENVPDGVPYIRTGDIKNGKILVNQLLRTSPEIAQSYKRSQVGKSDIIMSIRATIGTVALLPDELDGANLTQGTARISPSKLVTREYLFHYLKSDHSQNWISSYSKGATFREITLTKLRELPVLLPPINLQDQFTVRIKNITVQNEIHKTGALNSESLFNSILQKAFKGELIA